MVNTGRSSTNHTSMIARLVGFILLTHGAISLAQDIGADHDRLTGVFGPYVYHYYNNASYNDLPIAAGLEWEPSGSWLEFGAIYFRNSYYEDSVYAYAGKRWFIADDKQGVNLSLIGGPIYGYRGDHEKRILFDHNGLGVAIAPIVGYQYRSVNSQLVVLGNSAIVLVFGYDFWR